MRRLVGLWTISGGRSPLVGRSRLAGVRGWTGESVGLVNEGRFGTIKARAMSWDALMNRLNPFATNGIITNDFSDLEDKYEVLDELGTGRFGVVRRVRLKDSPDGETVIRAAKTIKKEQLGDPEELRNEIQILQKLDHPHVMGLVETIEDHENIHIISNLCTGGELFDRIIDKGTFSEKDAATLIRQVLLALEYCHKKMNIVHRDIKPENLLFFTPSDNSPLCLCDFGMSRAFKKGERMYASCGSPSYVAPEVLEHNYTEKCDIWSVGVILYILLCGKVPFGGSSDTEIMENVRLANYDFDDEAWSCVSDSAKDIICKMLEVDPAKRYSASRCLDHVWIRELGEGRDMPLLTAMRNMRSFNSHEKLKTKSLEVIARHLASNIQKEEADKYTLKLREIFMSLDKDGTGRIDIQTLAQAVLEDSNQMNSYNVLHSSLDELTAVLRAADTDNNGKIDINEFFAAALSESVYMKESNLHQAFKFFDRKGTGTITLDDFRESWEYLSEEEAEKIEEEFERYDLNHDGVIDYEEFVQFMSRRSLKQEKSI